MRFVSTVEAELVDAGVKVVPAIHTNDQSAAPEEQHYMIEGVMPWQCHRLF